MVPLERCPNFKPGQFLHLAIDNYNPGFHWPESRVFSIASSPSRPDEIKITFSVKGEYTSRMFNEIKTKDVVWLKFPYGSFTFDKHKNLIFVAGGTGITPFLSYLENAIDTNIDNNIRMFYGVRKSEYLIFDSLLQECKKSLENFDYELFIEQGDKSLKNKPKVNIGILDINKIIKSANSSETAFYLAGPQEMIVSFQRTMVSNGISQDRIFVDEWE